MPSPKRFRILALGGGLLLAGALSLQAAAGPPADTAAVQGDTCDTATPALPANFDPTVRQPWSVVDAYTDSLVFDLGGSYGAPVQMCDSCRVLTLRIQSESRAPCVGPDSLNGQPRAIGRLVKLGQSRFQYEPLIGFGTDNIEQMVFLVAVGPDSGYGLYRDSFDSTRVVTGLRLNFCDDGGEGPSPGPPNARFLTNGCVTGGNGGGGQGMAAGQPHPPRAKGGGPAEAAAANPAIADGWMACLTGCCRFYGPPAGTGAVLERDSSGNVLRIRLPNGMIITPGQGPN